MPGRYAGCTLTCVQTRGQMPRLRWATPAVAIYVVLVAIVMAGVLLAEGRRLDAPAWLGLAAGVVPWVLELAGLPWPRIVFALLVTATVAYLVSTFAFVVAPLFLLLLVLWVSYTGSRRESIVTLGLALISLAPFWDRLDVSVPWTVGVVAFWFAAQAMIAQRRTLVELRAAQANLAAQAAAAERQRIAGEIHDLIAHSLAVTMLHLTGARHILLRDPQRAEQALAEAERLGRQSLADVRRTVGLLQSPDASGSQARPVLAPLPTAADVPTLVQEYARAGMQVELIAKGDLGGLAAGESLAVYRIAQEALANVAKHATRAATRVELSVEDAQHVVRLRIRDCGSVAELAPPVRGESGGGMGLPGMRRRAELLGGSFFAGPDPAGAGWLVDCALPLQTPQTTTPADR
jgi:signal transduction histidine kinase